MLCSLKKGLNGFVESIDQCQPVQTKQVDNRPKPFTIFRFSAFQRIILPCDSVGCLTNGLCILLSDILLGIFHQEDALSPLLPKFGSSK